jgi:Ca2+-binding EF-hand superfamily protein
MSSLSINSLHHQSFADRFKKLDTDGDGKISKDEFVAGAPKGTDSTQAASLYDKLVQAASSSSSSATSGSTASDSSSTGLSAGDLQTAFQSLSGSTRSALFQIQANGQYGPPPPSDQSSQDTSNTDQTDATNDTTQAGATSHSASSRFHNFFTKLDADGDGKVSKAEFVAAAPPGLDATKAGDFYDQLAKAAASSNSSSNTSTSSSDSTSDGLSESDLKTAFDSLRSQGPQFAQANGTTSAQSGAPSINDLLKHISNDLDQILTASNTSSASTTSGSSNATTTASSSDSSSDTDSSSTDQSSTSLVDELSVISKQLEKLLAARKSYGTANANFAPFLGSNSQAAA